MHKLHFVLKIVDVAVQQAEVTHRAVGFVNKAGVVIISGCARKLNSFNRSVRALNLLDFFEAVIVSKILRGFVGKESCNVL